MASVKLDNATHVSTGDGKLAIVLPTLALPACLLCIPPLIAHYNAKNRAATVLVAGVAVLNLQNFVNALLWPHEPLQERWDGKGLCDVEVKLYIGITTATVGAIAAIFRQLSIILDTNNSCMIQTRGQKQRTLALESFLCIFIPVVVMGLHYVVQPQRYWIVTVTGCTPSLDSSWPSFLLILMWPVIFATAASVYCTIAAYRLVRYRYRTAGILSSSSRITRARYFRLFSLASILLVAYFPLSIHTFVVNLKRPHQHYSWSRIHPDGWSKDIPKQSLGLDYNGFDRWIQIATGYVLFLFFGLGHDALLMYKSWLIWTGLFRLFPCTSLQCNRPSLGASSSVGLTPLARTFSVNGLTDIDADEIEIGNSKTDMALSPTQTFAVASTTF